MHIRDGRSRETHDILLISTDKYMDLKRKKKKPGVTVFLTLSKEHNTSRAHS